jgi:hypothetical protein
LDGLANPWIAHAKLTVAAMIAWNLDETLGPAYVALSPPENCDSVLGTSASVANLAACTALCSAKKAWTMSGNLPSTASKTAGTDYCYGVAYVSTGSSEAC